MMSIKKTLVAVLVTLMPIAAFSQAQVYNLDLKNTGAEIVNGVDNNYTVQYLSGNISTSNLTGNASLITHSSYVTSPVAKWINPQGVPGTPLGTVSEWAYSTTFDLQNADLSSVVINGRWSADNIGLKILVNGIDVGFPAVGPLVNSHAATFTGWTNFNITNSNSVFIGGINTLTFMVKDTGVQMGLIVEFGQATATAAVPEPSSYAMMVIGLGIIGLIARRRKSAQ